MTEQPLNQLAPEAREGLQELVGKLVVQFQPEKIICFGCNSYRQSQYSCFTETSSETLTDYFLLIITADTERREHNMQDFVNSHYQAGIATILSHSTETVERAVQQKNSFFVNVLQHGLMVYAAKGFVLPQHFPAIAPKHIFQKAEQAYACRRELAYGFLYAARECLSNGYAKLAVFQLHQAVEQACIMLVNVHMDYRSDIHNISRLLRLCGCFHPEASALFPQRTQEEERLFRLLCKSYTEARYKHSFKVTEKEARELTLLVRLFVQRAEALCQLKLQQLQKEAQVVEAKTEESQTI